MTLYLTEHDVADLLPMPAAVDAVDAAFRAHGRGEVSGVPRVRLRVPGGVLMTMSAAAPRLGYMAVKTYTVARGAGARFYTWLYDATDGAMLAMIEANLLGEIRTGAASGVATRHFTGDGPVVMAVIGAGRQAFTQVSAVAAVRTVTELRVYSPTSERRESLAARCRDELGLAARAVEGAEVAVRGADVVTTITSAREPVLAGHWLLPTAHVNAAGSNYLDKREIDDATVARASSLVVDERATAQLECGDLAPLVAAGRLTWEQVPELGGSLLSPRPAPGISLFLSQGVAFEDLAVAGVVYREAVSRGRGAHLPVS